MIVPLFKDVAVELGVGFILLTWFVIAGSSNAVNLTDGLDGLAILPSVLVAGGLGVFAYLTGHALRIGLTGEQTSQENLTRLLPTIRGNMLHEVDQIRDAQFENYTRLSEYADTETNTSALARFLNVSEDKARAIAQSDNLFAD